MKKVNLKRYELSIVMGVKLLIAGAILSVTSENYITSFITAGLVLVFPFLALTRNTVRQNFMRLAVADTDLTVDEAKMLEAVKKKITEVVEAATKDGATKDGVEKSITAVNKAIEKLSEESKAALKKYCDELSTKNEALEAEIKKANDAVVAQGVELKKLKDDTAGKKAEDKVSFRDALKAALLSKKDVIMKEVNDDYGQRLSMKEFVNSATKSPTMVMKAPTDMFETNIAGNNVNLLRLTELDPQRVSIPLAIYPHVTDIFMSKGISRPYMSLMVVYSYEDGAATKAEGAASTKSSFLLKTVEFKAFFIATHFVLSEETLDDLDEVLDEISAVAPDKILDKIDSKIISAAGDDQTDIMGIMNASKSTAFVVPAGFIAADPSIIDLVVAAKLQASKNRYRVNIVVMNPTDIENLGALKNTLTDSKTDRRITFDALGNAIAIAGLRIIANESMPANKLVVADNRQPWIGRRRDMTVTLGLNGTDLVEGQRTLVINIRIAFGVRDKAGVIFVTDIAAAIGTIPTA